MEHKYNIELIRFKTSGKYYDHITFGTNSEYVWKVSEELQEAFEVDTISSSFDYMITGVGFPDGGFPALLKLASDREHVKSFYRYFSM